MVFSCTCTDAAGVPQEIGVCNEGWRDDGTIDDNCRAGLQARCQEP